MRFNPVYFYTTCQPAGNLGVIMAPPNEKNMVVINLGVIMAPPSEKTCWLNGLVTKHGSETFRCVDENFPKTVL